MHVAFYGPNLSQARSLRKVVSLATKPYQADRPRRARAIRGKVGLASTAAPDRGPGRSLRRFPVFALEVSRFDKKNSRFDKRIPGSILTGNFAENRLKCRVFVRGQVVAIPRIYKIPGSFP
jgi:hypothetical protein